ncbi:SdpA family antimicrobial peptide system protein [Jonesia quinghaiensis]|uniref:SdpA family antimicrobial peptide system protein n=1 Tax=Jonesia quinghaiensis TaxID=262806 RepID=UPI0006855B0E|nr:SdpA family antimicrobial peptide system protein [Jonesia quinghaiensis]
MKGQKEDHDRTERERRQNHAAAETTFRVSSIFFVAFVTLTVLVQLPTTVLGPVPDDTRRVWTALYPQGWQFFTKDPDDAEVTVFSVDGEAVTSASAFPNSDAKNMFGFKRAQRAQGPEVATLIREVEEWTKCDSIGGDCVLHVALDGEAQSVVNPSDVPTVCGRVIVVMTIPVPWEYRDLFTGYRIDDQAAMLEVGCT